MERSQFGRKRSITQIFGRPRCLHNSTPHPPPPTLFKPPASKFSHQNGPLRCTAGGMLGKLFNVRGCLHSLGQVRWKRGGGVVWPKPPSSYSCPSQVLVANAWWLQKRKSKISKWCCQ